VTSLVENQAEDNVGQFVTVQFNLLDVDARTPSPEFLRETPFGSYARATSAPREALGVSLCGDAELRVGYKLWSRNSARARLAQSSTIVRLAPVSRLSSPSSLSC
jgi:hypothetical protein